MKAALRYGAQHCCPQALGKKEPRGAMGISAAVCSPRTAPARGCTALGPGVMGARGPWHPHGTRQHLETAALGEQDVPRGDSPLLPPGLPAGCVLFSLNTASFSHYKSRGGYFP